MAKSWKHTCVKPSPHVLPHAYIVDLY